jgi:hypothetical protein
MDDPDAGAVARLADDVGAWDVNLEIRPGPDVEPIVTTGVATNRLVGGRWLVVDISTASGFEGHGVYGWNPTIGSYVGSWVDSMGPSIAEAVGSWDPDSRTMSYEVAVAYQGQTIVYREVTLRPDADTREYQNLMPAPDGTEFPAITATYRRRPAAAP